MRELCSGLFVSALSSYCCLEKCTALVANKIFDQLAVVSQSALVTVSEMCVQYFVNRGAFEWMKAAPAH